MVIVPYNVFVLNIMYVKSLVPYPVVEIHAPSIQLVSKPLTLECYVTTVRGITSRVDIVWSIGDFELRRTEGIESSLIKNLSVLYVDSYTIPQLGTVDEGRAYQCGVIINQALPITVNESITLDVTGEFIRVCVCTCMCACVYVCACIHSNFL